MAKRRGPFRRAWDSLSARTVGYYLVLLGLLALVWPYLPESGRALLLEPAGPSVPGLEFGRQEVVQTGAATGVGPGAERYSAAVAMVVAALLTLPVAWLYILTRQKKGFRQSVVHTLIILAVVVGGVVVLVKNSLALAFSLAGIVAAVRFRNTLEDSKDAGYIFVATAVVPIWGGVVVLVKNSLALAFSLAGIVAAVRFRNTLEDSKDAVYIFVATAVGLAAAVAPPGALAISLIYNTIILMLWYTDFRRTSAVFEGAIAEQRLEAARQFAGRGTGFIT